MASLGEIIAMLSFIPVVLWAPIMAMRCISERRMTGDQ